MSGTDEELVLGESQDELTGPDGKGFFGSDVMLFNAITYAILAAGLDWDLTYLGTGNGNGEKCMRGQPVAYGGVTYCNGSPGQSIAPMSRPLNNSQPGEANHCIARDAVARLTDDSQAADNAIFDPPPVAPPPVSYVLGAFCGDGDGDATSCASFDTWGEFMAGTAIPPWSPPSNPSNPIKLYRPDDASHATNVFKARTGCTNFCANVEVVVDVGMYPDCAVTDSVSECLGKIAANNVDALVYAGLEAHIPGDNKLLKVNGVEPILNNIRWGGYPLALFLYLNEGNGLREPAEQDFLDWALGYYNRSDAQVFENILMDYGFIACTDPTDPFHAPLNCFCP